MAIQKSGYVKASNILFGDQKGNFNYVEVASDESFMKQCSEQFMFHTNHYLVRSINPEDGEFVIHTLVSGLRMIKHLPRENSQLIK